MDQILGQIMEALLSTGGVVAVLGWGFFIVERYYVFPKRDKEHRIDLDRMRDEYATLSEQTVSTIQKLTILVELIKDRGDRNV